MNTKDHFCFRPHLLPAIALYPTQQNWKRLRTRNCQHTGFHISNFWSRRSLERKPWLFLIRWDLTLKQILITKTQKINLYSVRALKSYLNEKNLVEWWQRLQNLVHKFLKRISDLSIFISLRFQVDLLWIAYSIVCVFMIVFIVCIKQEVKMQRYNCVIIRVNGPQIWPLCTLSV